MGDERHDRPESETVSKIASRARDTKFLRSIGEAQKMSLLFFNLDQAKTSLRLQLEDNLQDSYAIPELVDRIAEYLLEVVQEDPRQKERFGC